MVKKLSKKEMDELMKEVKKEYGVSIIVGRLIGWLLVIAIMSGLVRFIAWSLGLW